MCKSLSHIVENGVTSLPVPEVVGKAIEYISKIGLIFWLRLIFLWYSSYFNLEEMKTLYALAKSSVLPPPIAIIESGEIELRALQQYSRSLRDGFDDIRVK